MSRTLRLCARFAIVGMLACAAPSIQAGPINIDTWYQFAFGDVGSSATGCDPADPAGGFCIPSSGTPTEFLDAPPWTFETTGLALLVVVDAFQSGDQFEVFDFGVSLGLTSAPGIGDCGDDPFNCLGDPTMSFGFFDLAPGQHSITIVVALSPTGSGSGYLRIAPAIETDEPPVVALAAIALAALGALRSRRRLPR